MQAIVLIEVYAIFKSRRPPLQVSKIFEEVYQNVRAAPSDVCAAIENSNLCQLVNDISVLNGNLSYDEVMQASSSVYLDEFAFSNDAKCKQRLFLACYTLDQQHATLFGRQRTACFPGSGMDLPFPKPQSSWDANHERRGSGMPTPTRVWEAIDGGSLVGSGQSTYDVFQSMLMMACLGDSAELDSPGYAPDSGSDAAPLPSTMEQSPRIKMAYHAFMLCKHTPIRDLLAVAGESWVMAEKLSSQADYTAAQIEGRHWAKGFVDSAMEFSMGLEQAPVNRAVRHALKLLELHSNHPKTGLLFQEWAVYLASVVIWARAYVTSTRPHTRQRLSIPNLNEPRLSSHELDQAVSTVIAAGPSSHIDLDEAKNVLVWTRARIENVDIPHNCGLTNGALDVLGRLVAKGGEEGWFGS